MKSINYGGKLYVNPSYDGLVGSGMSDGHAKSLMASLAADEVLTKRDGLLQSAALVIAPLQDGVDLGTATEAEKAKLQTWKQYRQALGRIAEQEGYPGSVVWPDPPAVLS